MWRFLLLRLLSGCSTLLTHSAASCTTDMQILPSFLKSQQLIPDPQVKGNCSHRRCKVDEREEGGGGKQMADLSSSSLSLFYEWKCLFHMQFLIRTLFLSTQPPSRVAPIP